MSTGPEDFAPEFRILLGGARLSSDAELNVVNLSVISEPDTLNQLSMTLANPLPEMPWTYGREPGLLREGVTVTVELGYVRGGLSPMFDGVVTSIAASFPEAGVPTLTVTGHTRMHALRGAKKTRTFMKKTDADIAKEVAGEAGLGVDADPGPVHEYVIQYNETDLAFLARRARRIGFELTVDGRTLGFKQAPVAEAPTCTLVWGDPQRAFRPGERRLPLKTFSLAMNPLGQVTEVVVRGQDPKSRDAIVGRASRGVEGSSMGRKTGADVAADAFGARRTEVVVDHPVASVEEATALARAIFNRRAARLRHRDRLHGRGARAPGGPGRRARRARTPLRRALLRQPGDAFVLERGILDLVRRGEELGRGRMTSLLDLLERDGRQGDRICGVVTAVVTNNQDEERLGRVRVRFPWLSESDESWWARVATPMAGNDRGFYFLPEVDDEVLVAFEHGDVRFPFVVGVLWGKDAKPPATNIDPTDPPEDLKQADRPPWVTRVGVIKSRSGHQIRFDDGDDGQKIEIVDRTGRDLIVIDADAKTIAVSADADITITSARGKLRLEGAGVEIESRAGVTVRASAALELTADGDTTVKGAVVNIN